MYRKCLAAIGSESSFTTLASGLRTSSDSIPDDNRCFPDISKYSEERGDIITRSSVGILLPEDGVNNSPSPILGFIVLLTAKTFYRNRLQI